MRGFRNNTDISMTGMYVYQPLDDASGQIRLVKLHLSTGVPDCEFPRCSLSTVELDSAPEYVALSYACGDPNDLLPIEIDGQQAEMYRNLDAALRRVRTMKLDASWLWIDCLCIHQNDLKEKSAQVKLMAQIYRRSTSVLVWLGEASDDSSAAFDVIEGLGKIDNFDAEFKEIYEPPESLEKEELEQKLLNLRSRVFQDLRHQNQSYRRSPAVTVGDIHSRIEWPELVGEPILKAIKNLQLRSWFQRLWVWQELLLAPSSTFVCGSDVCSGRYFLRGLTNMGFNGSFSAWDHPYPPKPDLGELRNRLADLTDRLAEVSDGLDEVTDELDEVTDELDEVTDELDKVTDGLEKVTDELAEVTDQTARLRDTVKFKSFDKLMVRSLKTVRMRDGYVEPSWSLLSLLHHTNQCECALAHDRVFALLGIARDPLVELNGPDYSMTVEEVYERLARTAIQSSVSVDLLASAGISEIASWIPDWRNESGRDVTFSLIITIDPIDRAERYNASLGRPPQCQFPDSSSLPRILIIQGIELDKIEAVGPDSKKRSLDVPDSRIVRHWISMLPNKTLDTEMQFWHTLTLDRIDTNRRFTPEDRDTLHSIIRDWIPDPIEKTHWPSERFKKLVSNSECLTFFTTRKKRYMGLGQTGERMQPDDLVCVLFGGQTPFILRPVGDNHILLGACYVHGIMDGEAMSMEEGKESNHSWFRLQ